MIRPARQIPREAREFPSSGVPFPELPVWQWYGCQGEAVNPARPPFQAELGEPGNRSVSGSPIPV